MIFEMTRISEKKYEHFELKLEKVLISQISAQRLGFFLYNRNTRLISI